MASTVFNEYKVHHSSPDGILVQLPGGGGFGRATKATLGGDALAERLLRSFSTREYMPGILRRARDAQGYRLLSVSLAEAWSELLSYPLPVRHLVPQLLRKHLLVGLGTTTAARTVRSSDKGTVFSLGPNVMAVAAYETIGPGGVVGGNKRRRTAADDDDSGDDSSRGLSSDDDDDDAKKMKKKAQKDSKLRGEEAESKVCLGNGASATVEVRLLNYDTEANVVNVTAKSETVEGTPMDTAVAASLLANMPAGTLVKARVLLSSTDDGCAVVEIPSFSPVTGEACSALGYYIYDWAAMQDRAEATAAAAANSGAAVATARRRTSTTAAAQPPIVGSTVELVVEFSPETAALQDVIHFLVLSSRTASFGALPAVRQLPTEKEGRRPLVPTGLVGHLPWRGDAMKPARCRTAEAAEDEEDAAFAASGAKGSGAGGGVAEPKIRKRKLEEAIDAYERGMDATVPTTPEEFQRLLLASPNGSYLWTQYMAHHIALQQFEEARQIAEKALLTIGAREMDEQLNVWVAYLNVENLYGTAESLTSVFKRALQMQLRPFLLHERLADIFAASRKSNQLLALCRTMTSKFRFERRAWERLGTVLADQDKRDQLKRVVKDMSAALKKNEAALAIVHIAIHEYKRGSVENGRALFEGLLAKMPRRSDVWSAYIDQELGLLNRRDAASSAAHVRNVFERGTAMSFGAKVTHEMLARFLLFEKANGSPADVQRVKERARAYVNAKIQAVTEAGVPEP